jgi:uncharacterized repeat protein (TIGR01451 family)
MRTRLRGGWVWLAGWVLAACGGGGSDTPAPPPGGPAVTYTADLQTTGIAPMFAVRTTVATYTMTLTNAGPDAASAVPVAATVSGGQSLEAVSCAAGGGATCPSSLGASMTVPSMPKGGVLTFTYAARVPPGASGSVGASIAVATAGDPQPSDNSASVSAETTAPNSIVLQSEFGDYIGAGNSHTYTLANAVVTFDPQGAALSMRVEGDQQWFGHFQLPAGATRFAVGTYAGLTRWPLGGATGSMDWWGEGRGCNSLTASMTVTDARYVGDTLVALDLAFEQHCEGMAAALRGQIHWTNADTTRPAGPVLPLPAGLWSPPAGATPASGNYVYLQSESGDYIGAGATATYTQANAILGVTLNGARIGVSVNGDETWSGDFQAMNGQTELGPGYYGSLRRYPFHNPARGGLSWYGEGRGCNTLQGWFVIDAVAFTNGALSALDLRFEQRCEGGVPALRGKLHWAAGDPTAPPGPVSPLPAGLWAAPTGATPASGNYVYLQSSPGDYVGQSQTYLYTPANAAVVLSGATGRASLTIDGPGGWRGEFQAMNTLAFLQPGYYGGLHRYPFHNPTKGGIDWSGMGRGCNRQDGWFVIDSVTYVGVVLTAIELRFEQVCEGIMPPLRGQIRWSL